MKRKHNSRVLAKRVLKELVHDKRTFGLLIVAPIILLSFVNILFTADINTPRIAVYNETEYQISSSEADFYQVGTIGEAKEAPTVEEADLGVVIENQDKTVTPKTDLSSLPSSLRPQVEAKLAQGISVEVPKVTIYSSGASPLNDSFYQQIVYESLDLDLQTAELKTLTYSYELKDYMMVFMMVFLVMFLSYITVGISFLRERKNKTMQRLLISGVKARQIVLGYLMAFSLVSVIQSTIILAMLYLVFDVQLAEFQTNHLIYSSVIVGTSIIINVFIAIFAISLGMFLSAFANNEFQIMQFIPLVIIPQIIFSGILPYGGIYETISSLSPLTYGMKLQENIILMELYDFSNYFNYLIVPSIILCLLTIFKVSREKSL